MMACTFPPNARCLPEYEEWTVFPLVLVVVSAQRSVGKDLSVQDYMRPALVGDLVQGLVQVRGLFGQDRHDLIPIAVGGGPTDTETGREHSHLLVLAQPHQPQ